MQSLQQSCCVCLERYLSHNLKYPPIALLLKLMQKLAEPGMVAFKVADLDGGLKGVANL